MIRAARVTLADEPARNELGISVERDPSPNIAHPISLHFGRAILLFRSNEGPDFVALDAAAFQVAKRFILIFGTGAAKIAEQLHDSRPMHARHSRDSAK